MNLANQNDALGECMSEFFYVSVAVFSVVAHLGCPAVTFVLVIAVSREQRVSSFIDTESCTGACSTLLQLPRSATQVRKCDHNVERGESCS